MNIAVCVSGIAREGYMECIRRFKKIFPYDFYFMHWNGYQKPEIENCIYFDEPTNHYNCMLDTKYKPSGCLRFNKITNPKTGIIFKDHNYFKKSEHWYKQLIAHELLVNKLDKDYDIIVKLRYDVLIHVSDNIKSLFRELEKKVFDEDITVGIAEKKNLDLSDQVEFHRMYDCPKCHGYTIFDYIIIHKTYKLMNVKKLYDNKNLLGAEWGAHQVFCQQWNQQFNYLNIRGGCLLYRNYIENNNNG